MSQPFPEQVAPGGVLIYPQIRSPDFMHLVSGWQISRDGSAEFNNVMARGTVADAVMIIEGPAGAVSGIYMYEPGITPGPGTSPIAWWTTISSTDPFGNPLPADFAAGGAGYFRISSQWMEILTGTNQPALAIIPPSVDISGNTDRNNIQGMLDSGYAVSLLAGTYYVNAPIELPAYAILRGAGRPPITKQAMTVIQAVGALSTVICSHGWLENTQVTPALGVNISDLQVNGNGTAVRGIVLQTFDSVIENVSVENTTFAGLQFSVLGIGGVVAVVSDAPNNRVISCSFNNTGSYGIRTAESGGSDVFTDGFIADCSLAGATVAAICVQQAAGWLISGNHLYGLSQHGMQVGGMDNTRIVGNEIETWGSSAVASTYRAIDGWTFPQFGVNGSVISGNSMWCLTAPGNAASSIEGINLAVEAGQSAVFAVIGNTLSFRPSSGFTAANGIVWTNLAATCTLTGTSTGNAVPGHWTNDFITVPDGGTITLTAGV